MSQQPQVSHPMMFGAGVTIDPHTPSNITNQIDGAMQAALDAELEFKRQQFFRSLTTHMHSDPSFPVNPQMEEIQQQHHYYHHLQQQQYVNFYQQHHQQHHQQYSPSEADTESSYIEEDLSQLMNTTGFQDHPSSHSNSSLDYFTQHGSSPSMPELMALSPERLMGHQHFGTPSEQSPSPSPGLSFADTFGPGEEPIHMQSPSFEDHHPHHFWAYHSTINPLGDDGSSSLSPSPKLRPASCSMMTTITDPSSMSMSCSPPGSSRSSSVSPSPEAPKMSKAAKRASTSSTLGAGLNSRAKKIRPQYTCPFPNCNRIFNRPFNLKSHGLTHEDQRPFACNECPKTFARIHDRDRHLKGHLEVKAFRCVVCLGRFARQDAVTRHLKLSNEQNPCSLILKSREISFRDAAAGRVTRESLGNDQDIRQSLEALEEQMRKERANRQH